MAGILKSIGAGIRSGANSIGSAAKNAGSALKSSVGGAKSGGLRSSKPISVTVVDPRLMRARVGAGKSVGSARGNGGAVVAPARKTSVAPVKPSDGRITKISVVDPRDPRRRVEIAPPQKHKISAPSKSKPVKSSPAPAPRPAKPVKPQPRVGSLVGNKPVKRPNVKAASPQMMRQAGFAGAAGLAEAAQQNTRYPFAENRQKIKAVPQSSSGGKWGVKMPDFSMNVDGRNRVDAADQRFINEQRDKTHKHKREQFEWEQAPKDRKADRHWNLINTGKITYKDGRANSDTAAIARELHRDRSLESFERKFNREWQHRLQSKPYASLTPDQLKAERDNLYDRMRRNHDRTYSVGRSIAGWRAERKAEKKQRKEDERNMKNLRLIRGWY